MWSSAIRQHNLTLISFGVLVFAGVYAWLARPSAHEGGPLARRRWRYRTLFLVLLAGEGLANSASSFALPSTMQVLAFLLSFACAIGTILTLFKIN